MLTRSSVPSRLKISVQNDERNLGSRSDIITLGTPQSLDSRWSKTVPAHSVAPHVSFLGIRSIRLKNLSVTVNNVFRSLGGCPSMGSPTIKLRIMVWNGMLCD